MKLKKPDGELVCTILGAAAALVGFLAGSKKESIASRKKEKTEAEYQEKITDIAAEKAAKILEKKFLDK